MFREIPVNGSVSEKERAGLDVIGINLHSLEWNSIECFERFDFINDLKEVLTNSRKQKISLATFSLKVIPHGLNKFFDIERRKALHKVKSSRRRH